MRILIVSHEYPPIGGGGANACMYLAREYAKQGHNVDIVTVWYEGLQLEETIIVNESAINIHRLKAKRKNKEHCGLAEMADFLFKAKNYCNTLIEESGYEIDICQIFFGIPSGPIGYYLKKKYKIPYVIRFGGGDIPGFQERFTKVYKLLSPFIKQLWKNADALVANSEGLRELAYDFCNEYPVKVFNNGVDIEKFYPTEKELDDNIQLLFVSRLIERKGLQYVIPKMNDLANETGKDISLLIVGDGPYRKDLEALVDNYDCRNRVEFIGQKDKDELLEYYQKGDIFVFPSKKEGMPNAVLEAMACGLPIVMSPCQGSSELIRGNGIITDTDLKQFYKGIFELVRKTPYELHVLGDVSRQIVEKHFSWQKVAKEYEQLFEEIIVKKGQE